MGYTPYRGSKGKRVLLTHRNISYHCDRSNSRGRHGLTMPRHSKTLRSICKDNLCAFIFILSFNEASFFVVNGYAKKKLSKHPQICKECISYPPRLLTDADNTLIKDLFNGDASCGLISNVIYQETGEMLSRKIVFIFLL